MKTSWFSLLPILALVACPAVQSDRLCDPGTEIFCKCRGTDAPGVKVCSDDGESFGSCIEPFVGECLEVEESSSSSEGLGGAGPAGAGGFGGSAAGECAHDLCEVGEALTLGCHSCVDALCQNGEDPFCCDLVQGASGSWDETCVAEAAEKCGLSCGGQGGAGGEPTSGSATSSSAMSSSAMSSSAMSSSASASSSSGGGMCPAVIAGALVITEIMNNPAAAADTAGEWFELHNPGPGCVELMGLSIASKSDTPHTIAKSVVVEAGGYAVLGRSADQATNGKVPVDYAYGSGINLGNDADDLSITSMGTVIDMTAWDGVGLDPNGKSRSLDPKFLTAAQNDDDAHYCVATSTIAMSTDLGTPGAKNDPCP